MKSFRSLKTLLSALTVMASMNVYGAYYNDGSCAPVCEPADCCESFCGKFSFDAEFLYWRATTDHSDFAVYGSDTAVFTSATSASVTVDLSEKEMSSKWSPGFRLGVGYEFEDSKWDTQLKWTDYYAKSSNSSIDLTGGDNFVALGLDPTIALFFPQFGIGSSPSYTGSVEAKLKTHLNVVDWEFGRSIDFGRCFTLRPHFDVRYASIKHSISQTATLGATRPILVSVDGVPTVETETLALASTAHATNKFYGVGPMAGLDLNWNWNCNWSVYGKGAFGLLLGRNHFKTDVDSDTTDTNFLGGGTTTALSLDFEESSRRKHSMRTAISLATGVEWKTTCLCEDYPLTVFAGWEQHTYMNSREATSFYGVNVGANIQF